MEAAIALQGIAGSSIRVNRVGGPFGHAGKLTMSQLRKLVVSPYVENAIPRNSEKGNIVLPLIDNYGAVIQAVPFYIGVNNKEHSEGVSPHIVVFLERVL